MKNIFCIILIVSSLKMIAQVKVNVPVYMNGDTLVSYKSKMKFIRKIGLNPIQESKYLYHYRIWTKHSIIEIYYDSLHAQRGQITYWASEFILYEDEPRSNRTFSKAYDLSYNQTDSLISLYDSLEISLIQDASEIKNWGNGKDGYSVTIELKNEDNYTFKNYWGPRYQDSIPEAKRIEYFNTKLIESIYNSRYSEFSRLIPYESYYGESYFIVTRVLTRRQKRKYKEERIQYRLNH